MADLSSILGGMVQGFKDFGTGLVDMFGTGGAAIGDAIESIRTGRATNKNQDDFRKWLYQTDNTQDAAAKGLGTILNGVQTVSDFIPGAGAITRNPLFNGVQGAIGGVADEFKMAGKDYDLGRAAQRAGVGAASGLASAYTNQALGKTGNKLINNGLVRGAAGGALAGGIANAGYTGIEGGSVQDMINAGLYGAQTGALVGGTTGLARELIKPNHKMDAKLTDEERYLRMRNIDKQLEDLKPVSMFDDSPEAQAVRARRAELQKISDAYSRGFDSVEEYEADKLAREQRRASYARRATESSAPDRYPVTPEKQRQFDRLQASNPMLDDIHTGIRRPGDIGTLEEVFNKEYRNLDAQNKVALQRAINGNDITVYSSKPFEEGVFVTPDKRMAQDYAGKGGEVYSKNISPKDIAWIDSSEGNYLPRTQGKHIAVQGDNEYKLYHQTKANSLADFDLKHRSAISGDSGVPEGLFLKDNDDDIGLPGKNQLELYATMNKTLPVEDRAALAEFGRKNSKAYGDLLDKEASINKKYEALSAQADDDWLRALTNTIDGKTPESEAVLAQAQAAKDKISRDWDRAINRNSKAARAELTKALKSQGYDSVVLENDEGGNGYTVRSNIVLGLDQLDDKRVPVRIGKPKTVADLMAESKPKTVADLMLSPDDDVMYSKVAEGQLGLFDQPMPTKPVEEALALDGKYSPKDNKVTKAMRARAEEIMGDYKTSKKVPENELYNKIDESTLPNKRKSTGAILDDLYSKGVKPDEVSNKVIDQLVEKEIGGKMDKKSLATYLFGDMDDTTRKDFIKKNLYTTKDYDVDDLTESILKNWARRKAMASGTLNKYNIDNLAIVGGNKTVRQGYTGALDSALSERLGIAPGNTYKQNGEFDTPGALGRYIGSESRPDFNNYMVKEVPDIEEALNTAGHERLHSFQAESRLENRYSKEVADAYNGLASDLKKANAYKSDAEIKNRYKKGTEYWSDTDEQEARMLQQYLGARGFTDYNKRDARMYGALEFDNDKIVPAFDKFFDKLRALSKKGVALPALSALFGGGAIMAATQGDDKKKKSEVK